MVILENFSLSFSEKSILSSVNFNFPSEKISVLLGPSGCGKSTILRAIAGLTPTSTGRVLCSSQNISFVFQEPRLLPWLTVEENVQLPISLNKQLKKKTSLSVHKADMHFILKQVGLFENKEDYPHQLSGGMKMRASIARALITKPKILLMDEPFAALDESIRFSMQDFLLGLQKKMQMTIVFVTHSFTEAVYLGQQIQLLSARGGQVLCTRTQEFAERTLALRSSPEYIEQVSFWSQQLRQKINEFL